MATSSSHGLGVSCDFKRKGKQYRARVFHHGLIDLGRFSTAEEARLAYDQAVLSLPGPAKFTNYNWGGYAAPLVYNPDVHFRVKRHLENLSARIDNWDTDPAGSTGPNPPFAVDTGALLDEEAATLWMPVPHAGHEEFCAPVGDNAMPVWAAAPAGTSKLQAGALPGLQQPQLPATLPGHLPGAVADVTAEGTQTATSLTPTVALIQEAGSRAHTAPVQGCILGMEQLQVQVPDPSCGGMSFSALLEDLLSQNLQSDIAAADPQHSGMYQRFLGEQQPTRLTTFDACACAPGTTSALSSRPAEAAAWQQQQQCSFGTPGSPAAASAASNPLEQPHNTNNFSPAAAGNAADAKHMLAAAAAAAQQQQQQSPSLLVAATSGDVLTFIDISVSHLSRLYTRLATHQGQHAGLITIEWMAEVRRSMSDSADFSSSSSSSQGARGPAEASARTASLHLCASLVALCAGDSARLNAGPFDTCFLASVLELLMKNLMNLRAVCAATSSDQGISSSTLQAWQAQVQQEAGACRIGQAVASLVAGLGGM